ncbi:MAG: glutamine--fructose-6-phosphate transaminase (isomerizing) [Candidatus Bathyarchaeota archaeon]|nr:MAG: glutamine--fructose-6-phosphate transaminase (isomerizing) [Candidatus Bathyarchaeota archaeon]
MCGIFGCVLQKGAVAPLIHSGLKRLEYRGYDSVGIATVFKGRIYLKKDRGKIDEVHARWNLNDLPGKMGIGHTRWATHGAPLQINAHPQVDCSGKVAVIHNGIIENFAELRDELINKNHGFVSKTDTEVIPHLIEENLKTGLDFKEAVREAVTKLEGSYAICVVYSGAPNKIISARKASPLVIGISDKGVCASSDIPTVLPLTNKIIEVNNGEIAVLSEKEVEIRRIESWERISRKPCEITWTLEMAQKQGYPHFMLKEIHEQPSRLQDGLRLQENYLNLLTTFLDRSKEIYLIACGTSYNACVAASYMFSNLCNLITHPVLASEFVEQYGNAVNIDSTILAVSQSGETADVLNAIEYARFRAATILGITNSIGSTLTRVARAYISQQSGPEIGVAATKTFTSQLMVFAQLALHLAKIRGKVSQNQMDYLTEKIQEIPALVEEIIQIQEKKIRKIAKKYKEKACFYFLGRGISTATAIEGRLKLLEIAYIPSIAYPAGESKHGPISLIEQGFPIIFVCPKDSTQKALIGNIMEMKARGGTIIAVVDESNDEIKKLADDYIEIPADIPELWTPIPYVIPLQLFAYYMAIEKGLNPDMPRNLAKSVTVL